MATNHTQTHPIADFLAHTSLGTEQTHKSLRVWPLLARGGVPAPAADWDYVTLDDACEDGSVRIEEVSQGGSVPHVRVTNNGKAAVLFLFGEEIRGAKQNRVANATFLVPARSQLVIDVSCVEVGRWQRRSHSGRFRPSKDVISSVLRKQMARRVTMARAVGDRFDAGQGEVWEGISARIAHSGTDSRSEAYADYVEKRAPDTDEVLKSFRPIDGQVGFVAAIGDEIVGLEAVGRPDIFAKHFEGLIRSYAIDAVDAALTQEPHGGQSKSSFDAPEPFLEALSRARLVSGPSLGLGEDLRLDDPALTGCALAHGELVHLTAFPLA